MFTSEFWKDAAERAIATFAQVVIALVLVSAGTDLSGVDSLNWVSILTTGLIAGGLAVLKALAASKFGTTDSTPSLVNYEYPTAVDTR